MTNEIQYEDSNLYIRYIYFVILAAIYLLVYFHRVSPAIMIPELKTDFMISPFLLGFYASLYFYVYAIMQLPVGILADSWGVKNTIFFFTIIAGMGCFIFAIAPGFKIILLSRVIIGLGVAGVYIPIMRFLANWFTVREFSVMTGVLMAVGNIGAIMAATPLGLAIHNIGWRTTFFIIGIITFILALLVRLLVRRKNESYNGINKNKTPVIKLDEIKDIISHKQIILLSLAMFGKFGPIMGVQGLWGIKYYGDIYKFSEITAGNILITISIGYIIGSPLMAFISNQIFASRKKVLICISIIYVLAWLPFWLMADIPVVAWMIVAFILGIVGGGSAVIIFSVAKETFSKKYTGTVISIVNMFVFIGAVIYQPVMGYILGKNQLSNGVFTIEGYRWVFLICIMGSMLMFLSSLFIEETFNE